MAFLKKKGNSDTCFIVMNLEDMMLSDISESQGRKCCVITPISMRHLRVVRLRDRK